MRDRGVLVVVLAAGLARWSFEFDSVGNENFSTGLLACMQVWRALLRYATV